jgi:TonB family protein
VVKPPEQKPQVKKVEPKQEVVKDKGDLPLTAKQTKKDTTKESTKPALNTTVVKRTNNAVKVQQEIAQRAKQEADRKYREDMARYNAERNRVNEQIGGIVGGVGKSLNKSTVASAIGPGGQAYAEYGSLVAEYYKRAVYATHPQSDNDADASIRIVVLRDGTVSSSEWVRRTGNSVLDKAVDRAMNSVRRLPQFPPETKDSERSFNITIAFEAKRVSA